MKTTFPKKSQTHQEIIFEIRDRILEKHQDKIAFIILFGSFARGDWVYDVYEKDNVTYEYASDYDIFILTRGNKYKSENAAIDLENSIKQDLKPYYKTYPIPQRKHSPSIIIEPVDEVNEKLRKGRYFYTDIKKEGVLLYGAKGFELAEEKEKTRAEKKEEAEGYFKKWFEKAEDFLISYNAVFEAKKYANSAFQLHQVTECLYHCALLVYTGHRPKLHDLEKLEQKLLKHNKAFADIFPKNTKEEEKLFNLLKRAYVDARYEKDYKIVKEQLEYLRKRVEKLKEVTKKACLMRIDSF
jgi:HEPN domain-containing protein/predicted nucleotidyltransferase